MFDKKHKKLIIKKWLDLSVVAFFVFAVLVIAIPQLMRVAWSGEAYPGVLVGNHNVGGMNYDELKAFLTKEWNKVGQEGIVLTLDGRNMTLYPTVTSTGDPDLSYDVVVFDMDKTISRILAIGRERDFYSWFLSPYISLAKKREVKADVRVMPGVLQEIVRKNYEDRIVEAEDARFEISDNEIILVPEKSGLSIDVGNVVGQIEERFFMLDDNPVEISLLTVKPDVYVQDIRPLMDDAREVLDRAPFVIEADITNSSRRKFYWSRSITAEQVQNWLGAKKDGNGVVSLGFNNSLIDYLSRLKKEIDLEARDAKFDISESGRITKFQASRDGRSIDVSESYAKLERDIIDNKQTKSELVVDLVEPLITMEKANNLGIKEVLGVGTSNFSGSPKNRLKNIKVASDKLNGLLIKPGEEFSLVKALKPFTTDEGYVPELVIKGTKLVPELGGGACQIGTTLFRAVLDAGLDITQRRNHSFAVSYYNDEYGLPGTDATIYDPAPDFRFKNDTDNYILIQTDVGDDGILTYTLWGTSDGRNASISKTKILDSFPAPDTKYIETEDLSPGTVECTGNNVPGYNTSFTYSITYSDGTSHEEVFDSYYRPFQRVCLVGIGEIEKD